MDTEILTESILEKKLEISLADRVKMQRDLMVRMGMRGSTEEKQNWIDTYARYFKDIELERPDLVAGYSELEENGDLVQERLSIMQNELGVLVVKNKKKAT